MYNSGRKEKFINEHEAGSLIFVHLFFFSSFLFLFFLLSLFFFFLLLLLVLMPLFLLLFSFFLIIVVVDLRPKCHSKSFSRSIFWLL